GLARQGLDVYRANGCATCHSEQVRQAGTVCDVLLSDGGTNQAVVLAAIRKVGPGVSAGKTAAIVATAAMPALESVGRAEAKQAVKVLSVGGAKAELWVVPVGPDVARGWGRRRSVAEDFLYDYPVVPGSLRVGPDLANVGMRLPDANW